MAYHVQDADGDEKGGSEILDEELTRWAEELKGYVRDDTTDEIIHDAREVPDGA